MWIVTEYTNHYKIQPHTFTLSNGLKLMKICSAEHYPMVPHTHANTHFSEIFFILLQSIPLTKIDLKKYVDIS